MYANLSNKIGNEWKIAEISLISTRFLKIAFKLWIIPFLEIFCCILGDAWQGRVYDSQPRGIVLQQIHCELLHRKITGQFFSLTPYANTAQNPTFKNQFSAATIGGQAWPWRTIFHNTSPPACNYHRGQVGRGVQAPPTIFRKLRHFLEIKLFHSILSIFPLSTWTTKVMSLA